MDTKTFQKGVQDNNSPIMTQYLNLSHHAPGTKINNRYQIGESIGSGGNGIVFKARDLTVNMNVAIKFINPEISGDKQKFIRIQREIKHSRNFQHPNLVKIHSLETFEGLYFLVMEYLEGTNLQKLLESKNKMTWDELKPIYCQILEGIQAIHEHKIIHRDLKPSNIFILNKGQIKVIDFGLTKGIGDLEKTSSMHEIVGSPHYISPEQINNQPLNYTSDIYQLGLILYRSLSGKHPYEDSNYIDIFFKHLNEPLPSLKKLKIKTPKFLDQLIQSCISKKPKDRLQNVKSIKKIIHQSRIPLTIVFKKAIKKMPLKLLLIFTIFLLTTIFFLFNSKKIHKYDFNETTLFAKNRIGITVWKRNVREGYKIYKIFKYPLQDLFVRENLSKKDAISTFLAHSNSHSFTPEDSVYNIYRDNRIAIYDSTGQLRKDLSQIENLKLNTLDFSPSTYNPKIQEEDLNGDGLNELIYLTHHSNGMYPSCFTLFSKAITLNYTNPGRIDYWYYEKISNTNTINIFLTGHNNLLAHTAFVTIFALDFNNPSSPHPSIPGVFSEDIASPNGRTPDNYIILPTPLALSKFDWESKGLIEFGLADSPLKVKLFKDYSIEVVESGSINSYHDPPQRLKSVYTLINKFFYEKWITHNNLKAEEYIAKALKFPVENPYLLSLLWYFKGDLEVSQAQYSQGEQSLLKAFKLNPYNNDTVHRLCEIPFLKNRTDLSLELSKVTYHNYFNFWGLRSGKNIFNYYCHLQDGRFNKSSENIFEISNTKNENSIYLESILHLFQGEYQKGVKKMSKTFNLSQSIFTSQDIRFVSARLHLLANQGMEPGYFYFKDLQKHSNFRKHLTWISVAYYLSLTRPLEAEKLAREGFEEVLKKSTGDFETRFWLFYEAYVYAKTMENLGNNREAIRGYQECIRANPYTALAKEAKKKLL